ncbi:MAG: hypothetical protein JXR25_01540 [Pontiellaceae bacterium]|nr:hypothetical protein [Pontiellaceae bacterium]MBN2783482.1 hypothetical protein [Pontiellaceae bacterium]
MEHSLKVIIAAILHSLFGLVLIWQGLSGNVVKPPDGRAVLARWVYVVFGLGTLILPLSYVAVLLQIK